MQGPAGWAALSTFAHVRKRRFGPPAGYPPSAQHSRIPRGAAPPVARRPRAPPSFPRSRRAGPRAVQSQLPRGLHGPARPGSEREAWIPGPPSGRALQATPGSPSHLWAAPKRRRAGKSSPTRLKWRLASEGGKTWKAEVLKVGVHAQRRPALLVVRYSAWPSYPPVFKLLEIFEVPPVIVLL